MNVLSKYLDKKGKIQIPNWVKRVKLDVGTSLNAPNSEKWLSEDNELCVFGFEPNKFNIEVLYEGQNFWPLHIKKERLDFSFFCINCALSDFNSESEPFYCTDGINPGTSSLFKPRGMALKEITKVPVMRLESFFDLFPWDIVPYIDQVKIDAQSGDYNIVKGMGKYLSEKVVYLDVETTTGNGYENNENPSELRQFIESNGFVCVSWDTNATFLNTKFEHLKNNIKYSLLNT